MSFNWDNYETDKNFNWDNFESATSEPVRQKSNNYGLPDYQSVLNDNSLSKEQQIDKIKQLGTNFNKQLDKETKDYIRKQRIGAGLEIASGLIPVGGGLKIASKIASPLLKEAVRLAPGLAASGGLYGIGNTLMSKINPNTKDYLKNVSANALANVVGGTALMGAMKGGKTLLNSETVKNSLPKIIESWTTVPEEYSKRAIEKELSGNSILRGEFDSKTAYRPIEEKLTNAKNKLSQRNEEIKSQYKNLGKEIENKYYAETKPQSWYDEQYKNIGDTAAQKYTQKLKPEEYFDVNYKKISDKALKSLEEEKIRRAQVVNEALNNLPENAQFKAADLRNDIQNIVDNYSLSGNPDINYGANAAQGKINQIEDLLYGNGKQRYGEYADSLKNLEFPKSYLETIKGRYKNTYHTKVLDNLNNDIVYAQRNFNTNILDKLRKNPEILQNPQEIEKLEKEVGNYAHFPYDDLNEQFYNKFYEALGKGDILQKGQNFVTPKELYDINKNIDHNMINWDKAGENTANGVLEQVYGKYSDRLNNLSPELANANEAYSALMDAQKSAGGIDPRTFGTKLREYNSGTQIRNGMAEALRNLDSTLPIEQRFLPQVNKIQKEYATQKYLEDNINNGALRNIANFDNLPLKEQNILNSIAGDEINAYKNLSLQQGIENDLYNNIKNSFNDISKYDKMPLNSQSALEKFAPDQLKQYSNLLDEQNLIKNTLNTVGSQYERNPKLLANRNDWGFENALENLQNKSNINFMDDLLDIRARDALEQLYPGQGGGSGNGQGYANNVLRKLLLEGWTNNSQIPFIGSLAGLTIFSPKIVGKNTIRSLGGLNNAANFTSNLYDYLFATPLNAELSAIRKTKEN